MCPHKPSLWEADPSTASADCRIQGAPMPCSPPCPPPPHGDHLLSAAGLVTVCNWDLHHCISTMFGIIFLQVLSHHSFSTPAVASLPPSLPAGSTARAVSGAQNAALCPTVPAGIRQAADRFLPTLSPWFYPHLPRIWGSLPDPSASE